MAMARVPDDWEAAYGVRPLAAYTYVGPDQLGTCYRAAGWRCCAARTSGCPPGRRAVAPKAVWIKPLAARWRERLCREPLRRLGAAPTPHLPEDVDWADIEYGRGSHPDGRLRDRVVAMGRAWEYARGASLPAIFPGAAEQRAAYRLLSNDRVTLEHILQPHQEATVDPGNGLLVRSDRGRQRRVAVDDGTRELWDFMDAQPVPGTETITISACGGPRKRRERKTRLELRAAMVDLVPPTDRAGDDPTLSMLAVSVLEPEPPKGKMPLPWVLLTTEGKAEIDHARCVVAWYEARWTIEEYFRILKVGTRVEDRKLDHADDLRKCLAFDAVTAWRVMDLERRARDTPSMPALKMFSQHEIKVLYVWLKHRRVIPAPPEEPPNIRTFVIDLARLGGFRPSKRQPLPGTEKIWQAWRSYKEGLDAVNAWEKQSEDNRVNSG